jgi:hypothetical protein
MEHIIMIRANIDGLPARRARANSRRRSAGYYAMLVVLLTGVALASWAVLAVHTDDVPAVRGRPGYDIEDAVDDCGSSSIGMLPEGNCKTATGLQSREG